MAWKNTLLDSEHFNHDYFRQDFVCRLCWSTNGTVELTSKSTANDATIAKKILECLDIDVTTCNHPKMICPNCLKAIEDFTEFRRFCREADKKLIIILKNSTKNRNTLRLEIDDDFVPINLKDETDFELEMLSLEGQKVGMLDKLTLKQEVDEAFSNYKLDDSDYILSKDLLLESNIYCYTCHIIFDSTEKQIEHSFKCHNIKNELYKCYGCVKTFKNAKYRLNHENRFCKALAGGYKCKICGIYLPKRKQFESHFKVHTDKNMLIKKKKKIRILKCHYCPESFGTKRELNKHMKIHMKRRTFICEICGQICNSGGNLYNHRLKHAGNRVKCTYCDFGAKFQCELKKHMRTHTGERPYTCSECPHRSATSSNLAKHKKIHLPIKSFKCIICKKDFHERYNLREHLSAVHQSV